MWQILIALAGIVGLLLLWSTVVVAIAAVVFYVVSFVPMAGRRRLRGRDPLPETQSGLLRRTPLGGSPLRSESRGRGAEAGRARSAAKGGDVGADTDANQRRSA